MHTLSHGQTVSPFVSLEKHLYFIIIGETADTIDSFRRIFADFLLYLKIYYLIISGIRYYIKLQQRCLMTSHRTWSVMWWRRLLQHPCSRLCLLYIMQKQRNGRNWITCHLLMSAFLTCANGYQTTMTATRIGIPSNVFWGPRH